MAAFSGFWVTFRTIFSRSFTQGYPQRKQEKVLNPRWHGRHQLNRWPDGLEKCVGCELCAWACPADAIFVEAADNTDERRFSPGERYAKTYQINYLRCIFCGLCIEACPTRALTMTNEFKLADTTRESLIFTKTDLLAALQVGMVPPPHERLLGDDEAAYFLGLPDDDGPDRRIPSRDAYAANPAGPNSGRPSPSRLNPSRRGVKS